MAEADYRRAGTRRAWAWETVTCPRCGRPFEAKRLDKRRYCSRACQNDHSEAFEDRRCLNCLSLFRYQLSDARRGGGKGIFCSRECSYQDIALHGNGAAGTRNRWAPYAERHDRGTRQAAERAQRSALALAAELASSPPARSCADCGRVFAPKRRQMRCIACEARHKEAVGERTKQRNREQRRRFRQSEAGRALKKKYKTIRRARKAIESESIDPIKVFDRDRWRCHLCGCKTPRRLRGTNEPNAPELDHIVSLADGGSHTWGNVACACRACNGAKGARSVGQLDLGLGMAA